MSENLTQVISNLVKFVPLLLLFFWPDNVLFVSYKYIRMAVIFFAIGGAVVSVLTLSGLISHFPYYILPPQETLHERLGYEYYVYGIFPTIHDSLGIQGFRACGMMKEPGHFAIILGIIYLIDRFREKKINFWIIIAGVLTFSSNFFIIVFITEVRNVFTKRIFASILKYGKYLFFLPIVYFLLPIDIREQVNYLFYERNLAEVFEALNSSSSLSEGLDMRANDTSVSIYEHISLGEYLVGGVKFDSSESLADYRGLILRIGLIGIIISSLAYYSTVSRKDTSIQISLMLLYILVLLHRSWMLQAPYLYFLSFLAVTVYTYSQNQSKKLYLTLGTNKNRSDL